MSADDERDDEASSAGRIGLIAGGAAALLFVLLSALIYLSPPKMLASLPHWIPHPGRTLGIKELGGSRLVFAAEAAQSDPAVLDEAVHVIERRLLAAGAGDAKVSRLGPNRIVVEAPGPHDPERLAAVLGKTGRLTFQMVDDTVSPQEARAGLLPPGDELLQGLTPSAPPEVVRRRAAMTGDMLMRAQMEFDRYGQPVVGFALDAAGARRFAAVTTENVGLRFAIVLDGRVVSAPRINGPITGGRGIIEGGFTAQSASDLALLLKSGALPVPLKVVEQQRVAPQS
jgi:preprotein translocase subunit SecD